MYIYIQINMWLITGSLILKTIVPRTNVNMYLHVKEHYIE